MSIAVILHAGAIVPLVEILKDISNLQGCGRPYDLFVNLTEGRFDTQVATDIINKQFPTAVIITSENRGMDIGGFFRVLPYVLKGNAAGLPYAYVLKLHTKSMKTWRRALINPICGSTLQVQHILQLLETLPKIGMIGSKYHLYRELYMRKPNFHYLQKLTDRFKIPYKDCSFIGGTMFWIRMQVLEKVFKQVDCSSLLAQLNTPTTFDPYWYLLSYRDQGVNTIEEAEAHFKSYGEKVGRYRNCMDARDHNSLRYLPDGMMEHAYERFFGLIVQSCNYNVHGVY